MPGIRRLIVGCTLVLMAVMTGSIAYAVTNNHAKGLHEFELTLSEREWLNQHPVIRVRISPGYPPFEFFEKGRFQGIEVDYLNIVAQRLGVKFQPVLAEANWAEALARFRSRDEVDMILGITHTVEREKFAVFTDDYISFPQVVFSRKDAPFISGVKDLDGMKVAIERGYVMRTWLSRDVPGIRFVDVDRSEEALDAVATGRADAYVGNLAVGSYFIEKKGLVNLKIAAPTPYGVDAMAMAVRKDWPELAGLINRALRSMDENDHRAIRTRWLSLRYEHGVNVKDVVTWTVTIIVAALFWIIPLRMMVKRRTTELQKEVQQRREGEQKLELILDNAPYAVYVLSYEGQGLYINETAQKMIGYSSEELLSMHFLDLVHPDDHAKLQKIREERIGGRPAESSYTIRVLDKSGSVRWAENHVIALSWGGEPATLNFLQDITERKKAEEELLRSEERYRAFIANSTEAIYRYELEQPVSIKLPEEEQIEQILQYAYLVECNDAAARLYGYDRAEDIHGLRLRDSSADLSRTIENTHMFIRSGYRLVDVESIEKDCQGNSRYFLSSLVGVVENDSLIRAWGVSRDITERKEQEAALRESEAFRKRVFESSHVPIVVMDAATYTYIDCNPAAVDIYRFASLEETLGKTPLDVSAPVQYDGTQSPDKARYYINRALTEGTVVFEWKHQRPDGELWDAEVHLMSFRSSERQLLQFTLQDITARRKAEEELAKSEERFRTAFSTNPDAIIISRIDDGVMIDVNQGFSNLTGYAREDVLNRDGRDLGIWAVPEDRQRFIEELKTSGMVNNLETQFRRKDGDIIYGSVSARVIMLDNIPHALSIGKDVTARKHAEDERERLIADIQKALADVSRSQREWQDTFNNITDMISIHDTDFNIIRANRAFSENLGLSPREVLNKKCYELMHHGATAPISGCPHIRSLKSRTPVSEEIYDEQTGKTLHVTTYPYFSPEGEVIGTIHIARDMTEEKEREMQMIMTERLASLGQMASGIAHEINNPLASVMMCAEMLLTKVVKDTLDHNQFEKYLKTIDEEVQRCRDITANMLSFARQTAAGRQNIDVHLLLDKAVDLVGFQGRLKNVDVVKNYSGKVLVRGNEGELRQVFLTLVVNALDAMKNAGILTIDTGQDGEVCHVRVSDTGPGIPAEVRKKIFQPFYTTKSESGGTGLGLSIAYRIVSNHQGSIDVDSEPGAGATFTVFLPC